MISATPCAIPSDEQLLRGGAASLARAIGARTLPLAVVRRDEIVIVAAAVDHVEATLAPRLADVQQRLSDAGLPLAVAVSTVVSGPAQIPTPIGNRARSGSRGDRRPGWWRCPS